MNANDYPVGTRVTLVTFHGPEWKAEVVGHTSLPCDLVVKWIPPRPSLHDCGTVCLYHVKEARRG